MYILAQTRSNQLLLFDTPISDSFIKWYPSGHGHCVASSVHETHHRRLLDSDLSSCHGLLLVTQVELAYFDGNLFRRSEYGTTEFLLSAQE